MSARNNSVLSFIKAQEAMALQIKQLDLKSKPAVYRIEIKIQPIDAIDWLEAQNSKVKIYGANQENTAVIAGIGEALTFEGRQINHFAKVFAELRSHLTPQYPYMQWYGGFCFDGNYCDAQWREFNCYRFVLPRFELAADGGKMIFACNLIGSLTELRRESLLKELKNLKEKFKPKISKWKISKRQDLPSFGQWDRNATTVLEAIHRGDCAKVVLARKTVLKFPANINPLAIFRKLTKVTPNSYHFYFQFASTTFLGASPERLYKRQGRKICSEAIAGTSPRGTSPLQDKKLRSDLLNSKKNKHEHKFVVDAIQSSLKPLCSRLTHKPKASVISLSNGHHLMTPFEGQLKDGVNDEDVLQSLHPTPAVAGTPRDKAMVSIRRMENFSRGWYAGPVGYVGLDWVEFVVGIRSGVVKGKELSVYAGAGIVKGSNSKDEWQEIENKISNFIKVIK
jgi:menaquinone-specific isochorismate synthase